MRAVVLTEFGGPEVLRFADIPVPQPDAEEVLVAVRATALNRADLMQRMGLYPNPSPVEHDVPGLEFAGVVTAVGSRVREHAVGDAVMGIVSGGGYAEYLVVHERQAMRVPSNISVNDAAAIPEGNAVPLPAGIPPEQAGARRGHRTALPAPLALGAARAVPAGLTACGLSPGP